MTYVQKIFKTLLVIAGATFVAMLSMAPFATAQTVTQGYGSDVVLQRGMIVGLKKDDLRKVEPINNDQYERLHGVVIGANDSAVLLGNDNEKVYVASGGRFSVLVSDQAGSIKQGDYIAVSSVAGIGMKGGDYDPVILGKALESFKGDDAGQLVGTAKVKDTNGKEQQIKIGRVLVDVSIGKNPLLKSDNNLPNALRRASEMIAGKSVSPIRVYLSLVILVVAAMIAGSLIYSAVRSSLIAIGRNPLSKKSIIRGLFQVVIIGLMVFLSGIFGVYLLLRL
ncbi:MAG: hypothetical protein U0491_03025 [Candidatus Saccharimonadales bacterium]